MNNGNNGNHGAGNNGDNGNHGNGNNGNNGNHGDGNNGHGGGRPVPPHTSGASSFGRIMKLK